MSHLFRFAALFIVSACAASLTIGGSAPAQSIGEYLAPEALQADLENWRNWMANTHPDLDHSVDAEAFEAAFASVKSQLEAPQTRREAWLEFARLNPILADAHVGLAAPEPVNGEVAEQPQSGFPLPVRIRGGALSLAAGTLTEPGLTGALEIVSINGVPSTEILAGLMARMRGESARLRAHILELKFAQFLNLWLDTPHHYSVELLDAEGRLHAVGLPASHASSTEIEPFEIIFSESTAILIANSFDRRHAETVHEFLPDAFAQIRAAGSETLIIDLRSNGGGAREVSDPLMAYLTERRHTPISAVKARITEENQSRIPGSQIGEVVELPFALWSEPPTELANRFAGEVIVLVGPGTYSQAIAFAATVQDFEIGRIAGTETEGRANQTAQVQQLTLPNTGFTVRAPLYIFTRASGDISQRGVVPDLPLDGDSDTHLGQLLTILTSPD